MSLTTLLASFRWIAILAAATALLLLATLAGRSWLAAHDAVTQLTATMRPALSLRALY